MYILTLTREELNTINFVGHRYSWADILSRKTSYPENDDCDTISFSFAEHEAWEIKDTFEADTEGGHSFFPMLDPNSELAAKLAKFYEEIV